MNIATDSLYVVGVVKRLERLVLKECKQKEAYALFCTLWFVLEQKMHDYFICHICSHSGLSGILVKGNDRADACQ